MSKDRYTNYGKEFPSVRFEEITPSDTDSLERIPRSLYIGTGGDLVAVDANFNEVTFVGLAAGTILPIQPSKVKSSGTTASDIIGLY